MSYRRPGRRSQLSVQSSASSGSRRQSSQRSYVSQQSGGRRHQFQSLSNGTPLTLTTGLYFQFILARFRRSFDSGADTPPTATASNNFQSADVFNGSKITNYNAVIRIKNRGAVGGYLDVYEVALSFFDVLIWNTIQPTACPFTIDTSTSNLEGIVAPKAITNTLVVANTIKNFKFVAHYMKHRGTVFVTNEDGGNGGEVTININKVPAKCRRSQTGMFWGLIFHNDSDKNGSETLILDATINASFEEIPSDNRLPFLE